MAFLQNNYPLRAEEVGKRGDRKRETPTMGKGEHEVSLLQTTKIMVVLVCTKTDGMRCLGCKNERVHLFRTRALKAARHKKDR